MLVHIMDQRRLVRGDGPIGLVLVPTRELAMQIYTEAKKFGKIYEIQVRLGLLRQAVLKPLKSFFYEVSFIHRNRLLYILY